MRVDGLREVGGLPGVSADEIDRFGRHRGASGGDRERARGAVYPAANTAGVTGGVSARASRSPILLAFALPHPHDHARAVAIGDLQLAQCGHPQPRGRECGEDSPGFQVMGGAQQRGHLRLTQERRQGEGPPGIGDIL